MRRAAIGSAVLALVALWLTGGLGDTTDAAAPPAGRRPDTWTRLASMPSARQEVAVATLGGKVFVIGGFGADDRPVATVEVYDPATDTWKARAPLPAPSHHPAAAAVRGRLFVVGGYTGGPSGWAVQRTTYEYDAARDTWVLRAPLPTARGALAVAALNGRLHAVGGSDGAPTGAHEVYDPVTDRWAAARPLSTPRDHLAAVAFQDRVWAISGRHAFGAERPAVEIYDPATDRWVGGPSLPTGRGGLAAVALADRIFVFGGEAPGHIFGANEMYEGAGRRWIARAPMPTPRHGIGAALVEGRIYIPGGATIPGLARSAANEAYTP